MFRGFHTVDIFDCPPFRMFTNADDPVSQKIRERRAFEPHSMRLWCQIAKTATAILDIGAHVGVYALAAAALRSDLTIHAFEPNPYTAARLRVNKHANGYQNLADHPVALSDTKNLIEIAWRDRGGGWLSSGSVALAGSPAEWERRPVYTAPLDDFHIDPGQRPLVKMDVEGAEMLAFKGMRQFLKSKPAVLLESFYQPSCDAITEMLPGYRFAAVEEEGALNVHDRLIARDSRGENFNQLCIPDWLEI